MILLFDLQGKDTLLEGGIRGSALVWSPLLNSTSRVHNGLMHIQDWIPTFIAAAKATHHFPGELLLPAKLKTTFRH